MAIPDREEPRTRIIRGNPVFSNNGRPDPETGTIWYRHDKVLIRVGETWRELEGSLQTTERRLRILGKDMGRTQTTTITSCRGAAVMGHQVTWLILENGVSVDSRPTVPGPAAAG